MKTIHRITTIALLSMGVALFPVGCGDNPADQDDHDEHAGHEHAGEDDDDGGHQQAGESDEHAGHEHGGEAEEPATPAEEDDHAGHDHAAEDAGSERSDEDGGQRVELTPEQRTRIGLQLATAGPGSIVRALTFPGEVVLNPDRVAHVVPRAAGIVRKVTKTVGDTVAADEVIAWIESAELAEAKLEFYAHVAEVGRSMVELPRAKLIFDNVNRLLSLLEKDADDDELAALAGQEMGEYRGRLLTAHAELVASRKALDRERTLREKGISSAQDLVSAQAAFQSARAHFNASLDTARFEVLVAFGEAARLQQVAEFGAVAAEQQLRLRGVDDAAIQKLRELAPKTAALQPCECPKPGCEHNTFPSVRETLGLDEQLGWYSLRAPFAGVVIEKHLTLGEKVGEDESVFVVADTSTVWVNLSIFQKDLASVETGQEVAVDLTGGKAVHTGTIDAVSQLVDPDTRTARARVVLKNEGNGLRPGLFVTVRVALPTVEAAVVIPRSAIQILDQRDVVFVEKGDGFEAVPVELGDGDRTSVEVTHGLEAGQRYVDRGAFELKAKVATSGLGAHAGHGH